MPRKIRSNAASSASAAANTATPTFTSFAAVTAQALGTYGDDVPVTTAASFTEWDTEALNLLKKLTKRDATTKQRALADLSAHLTAVQKDVPDAGTAFISAWATTFPSLVIDDPTPAVRATAATLTATVVETFGRATKPVLPAILPPWVSALGDLSPLVSNAASDALESAFPAPDRRRKAATRYASHLRDFCSDAVASYTNPKSGNSSAVASSLLSPTKIVAVLQWLLTASDDLSTIAPFIDAPSNPLRTITRAKGKVEADAGPQVRAVANLAIDVIRHMKRSTNSDEGDPKIPLDDQSSQRLERIGALAVALAKTPDSTAWDLFLVLLREVPESIISIQGKLIDALASAAATSSASALSALLPVADALTASTYSVDKDLPDVNLRCLLDPLRKRLFPKHGATASAAFAMAVLPSYIEFLIFVQRVVAERCFSSPSEREKFLSEWTKDYVSVICQSFVSGTTPPLSPSRKVTLPSEPGLTESTIQSSSKPLDRDDITSVFGKLFKLMPESQLLKVVPQIASAILLSMRERNTPSILPRLGGLLDSMANTSRESFVIRNIVSSIVSPENVSDILNSCRIVSFLLNREAASDIANTFTDRNGNDVSLFVERVNKLRRDALCFVTEHESLSDEWNAISKDIACLISWVIWSWQLYDRERDVTQQALEELRDTLPLDRTFTVVCEVVNAHGRRRSLKSFSPCNPLKGDALESIVRKGVAVLKSDENASLSAINFLSITTDGKGGAALSPNVLREVFNSLSLRLARCPKCADFDPLILSLLTSPVQHLDHYSEDFDELVSASLIRATLSERILTLILTRISSATTTVRAVTFVEKLIAYFDLHWNKSPGLVDDVDVGTTFAKIATTLHERDNTSPAKVFMKFLYTAPHACLTSFLDKVPFQVVFGGNSGSKVNVKHLLEVLQHGYGSRVPEMLPRLQEFCDALSKQSLLLASSEVTNVALCKPSFFVTEVIKLLCSVHSEKDVEDAVPLSAIAGEINDHLTKLSFVDNKENLTGVPQLVHLCAVASKGRFVEFAKELLTNAANIIRKDPAASSGFVALDVMSGSLGYHLISPSEKIVEWWQDLLSLVLRTIRRCLEQPRGLTKVNIERLETHCACYVYQCVKGVGRSVVNSDDVRFWVLRARDALEKAILRLDAEGNTAISAGYERIAWIYNMSFVLLDYIDDNDEGRMMLADEISHWSTWSGIYCIPTVEPLQGLSSTSHTPESVFARAGAKGWAGLTIRAAERGVVLGKQGEIGADANDVYALIPWLGCQSEDVRKAVLIVTAYAAAIDFPVRIEDTFPESGFSDERAEVEYATRMVPQAIRDSLKWSNVEGSEEKIGLAELKYFLTWRLFFDLIAPNDDQSRSSSNEEKCFRYVGNVFLRNESDLVSEFFKHSVDVVVDGSAIERRAAALSAEEALRASERVKQGIQLAEDNSNLEADTEEVENQKFLSDVDSDKVLEREVGRAAGIAFARALQWAPALSREFMSDKIDRGTWTRVEAFVRRWISPPLVAEEIRKVKEWGAFGGGKSGQGSGTNNESEGELHTHGSVAGREVRATYTFSDVFLEIGMHIPDVFPLRTAQVEPRGRVGMSETRWRKTLLGMTTLLQSRDGSLAEAVELWRRNLDKCFQGVEECPICYSVLHLSTAALPKMQCRTCKNLFHSDCLFKWFTKSNSKACPLCRSAF